MAVKNNILPITLTSFDSAGLTGSYQPINSNGISNASFFIRIINDSNVDVTVSYDGSTDHDFIPTGTILEINGQSNHRPESGVANFSKGTIVYVKGSAGSGSIYLAAYYQN